MAGSLAAVKKELRKKIREILKELPEATAATQSMIEPVLSLAQANALQPPMPPKHYCPCPSTRQLAE
jgi:hypothetical protein